MHHGRRRQRRICFLAIVLSGVASSVAMSAPAPSKNFNVPGQRRTRTCAEMKTDKIPLRFADGTPNGFFAYAADPSKDAKCPVGCVEIDAHEIITTASGMKLLFHPGGGPKHYEDHVDHGQYGHVAIDDLKSPPPKLTPKNLNGKPASIAAAGATYLITPTRIPRDMWYKPNVSEEGRSGSTYFTYGNPGHDKTHGRGDFTYINWSWVQNGGAKYPENICRGGGMVRALGKRGMIFRAADVEPIIGYSYGGDNEINGRVTAFYGRTTANGGTARDGGSEIFGWLPHSYQKTGDIIVPCVRRKDAPTLAPARERPPSDPMERMAQNLLFETPVDPARRTELLRKLSAERDPQTRLEMLTELSRMDDAESVRAMLKLLRDDKDTRVREQAIALIGFMRASADDVKSIAAELKAHQARTNDARERERVDEAMEKLGLRAAAAPLSPK